MSLMSFTGKQRNLLDETPEHCRQLKLAHPILTNEDMERLRTTRHDDFQVATLPAVFSAVGSDPARALGKALDELIDAAERAIAEGASLLILSDRDISPQRAPIPSLLATAALHHGLLRRRLRSQAGVVESGEPREVMHFCSFLRLRRQRRQPVSRLRGRPKTPRRRRSAERRRPSTS